MPPLWKGEPAGGRIQTLESLEYRLDLGLTLMKYGEALVTFGHAERARGVFGQARQVFADASATRFVDEIDTWLLRVEPALGTHDYGRAYDRREELCP
jgi:hypothetical protein